jgi:AcrR family transcriptional regulator
MINNKANTTKTRILAAAYDCFLSYGYSKTTFKDIVEKAGISRASLYLYYKDKEDLFIQMNQKLHEGYLERSGAVLKTDLSDKEKIIKIIDIWIINHYRQMKNTNYANELLDGLVNISKQTENKFRELFIQSLTPVVGENKAEIVVFSIRGLMDDRPNVKTLQKRIGLLVDAVTGAL